MKIIRSITMLSLLIVVLNCKNENGDPSPQDLALQKLTGQWTLGNTGYILLNEQNVSDSYPSFTLSFDNQQYEITHAGDMFNGSGSWKWVGTSSNQLITDNGLEINILDLTANSLEFTFVLSSIESVTAGLSGNYRIRMVK